MNTWIIFTQCSNCGEIKRYRMNHVVSFTPDLCVGDHVMGTSHEREARIVVLVKESE
jgi:RNase P subunit RPR2